MAFISSSELRYMRKSDWDRILLLDQIPDTALEYFVGVGEWKEHCRRFNRNIKRRINAVRDMTLNQQCQYYRGKAFIRAGQ